jgi:3-deoxy-D-manno-octulosonic-acid transferase
MLSLAELHKLKESVVLLTTGIPKYLNNRCINSTLVVVPRHIAHSQILSAHVKDIFDADW